MHYPACAALERKKQRFLFLFWRPPNRVVSNGKLDCKSGAAAVFFLLAADVMSKERHSRHGDRATAPPRLVLVEAASTRSQVKFPTAGAFEKARPRPGMSRRKLVRRRFAHTAAWLGRKYCAQGGNPWCLPFLGSSSFACREAPRRTTQGSAIAQRAPARGSAIAQRARAHRAGARARARAARNTRRARVGSSAHASCARMISLVAGSRASAAGGQRGRFSRGCVMRVRDRTRSVSHATYNLPARAPATREQSSRVHARDHARVSLCASRSAEVPDCAQRRVRRPAPKNWRAALATARWQELFVGLTLQAPLCLSLCLSLSLERESSVTLSWRDDGAVRVKIAVRGD